MEAGEQTDLVIDSVELNGLALMWLCLGNILRSLFPYCLNLKLRFFSNSLLEYILALKADTFQKNNYLVHGLKLAQ